MKLKHFSMKTFIIILSAITLLCIQLQGENFSKDGNANQSHINYSNIYGTWYVKQILINGEEDPENFPVSNDELTLGKDMSVISIDKTYDMVDKGTWEIKKPDMFIINTEDGSVIFKILKMTSEELETKMLTDELEMVIKYRRAK